MSYADFDIEYSHSNEVNVGMTWWVWAVLGVMDICGYTMGLGKEFPRRSKAEKIIPICVWKYTWWMRCWDVEVDT